MHRAAAAALVIVLAGPLSGCGTGTLPSAIPTVTLPTIVVPTINVPTISITVTPPTLPERPTASTRPDANSQGSGLPTWLWIVIAVAAVVGIVAAIASARRRRAFVNATIADVVSRGTWVVDHGTNALLAAPDATAVQQAWASLDGALTDLTASLTRLNGRVGGDTATRLLEVRDATSALRLAAEAQARSRLAGEDTGAPSAVEALFAARRRLGVAIASLDPSQPPAPPAQ